MKIRLFITACLLLIGVVSCDEEKLNPVNPNQLSVETFFVSGPQLEAGINAAYSALQGLDLYIREYFFLHDMLSDDTESGGGQLEAHRNQILQGAIDPSNPLIISNWRGWYRVIHRANIVLDNAENATEEITEDLRNRIIGEAYFLRGWGYYELGSLWGGVPLMTTMATSTESATPRSTEEETFQQAISDLTMAAEMLPPKSAYGSSDLGRATNAAAQAMLAKVHLFRGDFAAARPLLQAIIGSGEYDLTARYLDNFEEENEHNIESIHEVIMTRDFGDANVWDGDGSGISFSTFRGQEYSPTAWRNLVPSMSLVNAFEKEENGAEKDDPRFSYNFYQVGDTYNNGNSVLTPDGVQGDNTRPSWRKYTMIYKQSAENMASGINFRVIRYADVLLMMAEVENELGNTAGALEYLNATRQRADVNMPLYPTAQYPTGTQEQMRRAIQHERQVEFPGEQIRNRDIRRWRRLNLLDGEPVPNFRSHHDLLPLPFAEIDNNPSLGNEDQNPGY
ncbi:RagB/SusD family nutrient uptake outer membrane protein [Arthrospiribacter ruber]|uniref:RagB/SusD family nutrient uptake outer membrane protein n=1 Tax=Arthrospiribacter ruber TaxID=2487934 RepID=A0A951IYY4_9BACT|nr:RagB/SusD family nutrient uptake outer membrane protein [Arthrospiribacter ruber]MBW3468406.1 RagB/SusD family nutrient uptake outer membrane protein [Arthrospiribacter ruber]